MTKEDAPNGKSQILEAISQAMAGVRKVTKGERNNHDNYNFASIDDFLAMLNPICAENHIFAFMEEKNIEDFTKKTKYGESSYMRLTFAITLFHKSGETLGPLDRTVEVLRNGAQAYGSAQSYALKQYFRALLLIPTGDKDDADHHETSEGTVYATPQTVTPDQFIKLRDKAEEADVTEEKVCTIYKAASFQQFPQDMFERAMKKLQASIDVKQSQPVENFKKIETTEPQADDAGFGDIPFGEET